MIQQPVSVGDVVTYHGSITEKHGEYVVVLVPVLPGYRGYILQDRESRERPYKFADRDQHHLSNVHRDSFTLKEANVYI